MFVTVPGIAGAHNCCTHPMLKVIVTNITTSTTVNSYNHFTYLYNPSVAFPCSQIQNSTSTFYLSGTTNTASPSVNPFVPFYTKWNVNALTLLPYKGDSLQIDFIASRCSDGTHFGYSYLDAQDFTGNIYTNSVLNTSGSFTACSSATLSTIPNYSYSWNGPNTTIVQTQSIVVNTSGVYSLTISDTQSVIATQTINVTINDPVSISILASNDSVCANETVTLYASNLNLGPYFWSNGGNTNSIVVNPTVSTFYYLNAVDSNGCLTFASKTVEVVSCTSIDELALHYQSLKLYPQPTTDDLNLTFEMEAPYEFSTLKVYNSLGQVLKDEAIKFVDGKAQLKTTDLTNGIYTLQLSFIDTVIVPRATRNDGWQITKKFVIAR
jgi:hypothetical protein